MGVPEGSAIVTGRWGVGSAQVGDAFDAAERAERKEHGAADRHLRGGPLRVCVCG